MAKKPHKRALVLRWGAYGDHVFATVLYPVLKEEGYAVHLHCKESALPIVKANPHIDRVIVEPAGDKWNDNPDLENYWNELGSKYDRFINLSGSVESNLLFVNDSVQASLSKHKRHQYANHNYWDEQFIIAGYPDIKGRRGEIYLTPREDSWGREFKRKHGKFLVVWSLSGSSFHKVYPFTEEVARAFLGNHPDAHMVLTGDGFCKMLTWSGPQVTDYTGGSIREAIVLTKYANLVIGTETGLLNAASCFDTPKIVMLSHSTVENWTKYWTNTTALSANVSCQPCHILHYELNTCPVDAVTRAPICMAALDKRVVLAAMEVEYDKWRSERG